MNRADATKALNDLTADFEKNAKIERFGKVRGFRK